MAESRITVRADTSALTSLNTLLDQTRQKLTSAASATQNWREAWEELPGGGLRRVGHTASPGAGTYVAGAMAQPPMGRFTAGTSTLRVPLPSTPAPAPSPTASGALGAAFQQATPHVQRYSQALGQAQQQASTLGAILGQVANVAGLAGGQGGRQGTIPPGVTGRAAQVLQQLGYTFAPSPGTAGAAAGSVPPIPPGGGPPGRGAVPPSGGGPWGGWTGMMPQSGGWGAWTGMIPPRPPRPPGTQFEEDEEGPNRPGFFRRTLGAIQRPMRILRDVTIGVGLYHTLTEAMQLYEQRARGIIAVGMQQTLQFDSVGKTIDTLRTRYHVLAHDSIAAMQAMGRVAGTLTGVEAAVSFGTAYGMDPAHAAGMAALAGRFTAPSPNPLAAMATARHLYGVSYQPMAVEALLEETTRMAQLGSAQGVTAPAPFYGRMAALLGGMGAPFQTPGAIAGAFQQLSQGLTNAPDEGIYAMRMRALTRLRAQRQAQGLGTQLTVGQGPDAEVLDLANTFDLEKAMELANISPEIQAAYEDQAHILAGNREELMPRAFWNMIGGRRIGRVMSDRLRRSMRRQPGGGFLGLGRPDTAVIGAEEAAAAERRERREARPEFESQRVQAQLEPGLERLGQPIVHASNELKDALGKLSQVIEDGKFDWQKLTGALTAMSGSTQALMGVLTLLSASGTAGQILGGTMLATGAITGAAGGWNKFSVAPEEMRPGLPGFPLPTQPQKQGP